jgi:hypothetical protein
LRQRRALDVGLLAWLRRQVRQALGQGKAGLLAPQAQQPRQALARGQGLLLRLWVGGTFPGWLYFTDSLAGALIWPLIHALLLAPQRRPVDRDETRPL